jgi:hypothetical protein
VKDRLSPIWTGTNPKCRPSFLVNQLRGKGVPGIQEWSYSEGFPWLQLLWKSFSSLGFSNISEPDFNHGVKTENKGRTGTRIASFT